MNKVAIACCVLLRASTAGAGHTLTPAQTSVLQEWLSVHRGFRPATIGDCDCAEDIAAMRKGLGGQWKPVPDYQPYAATGDFNGDGHGDFAVVVVDTTKSIAKAFALVVFNGPIVATSKAPSAAFERFEMDLRGAGLFFGLPRPQPFRLLVGGFESEGRLLQPTGRSYRLSSGDSH